ncbi:neuraminidase-like domain-containing protein [Moritella sp. 28]|uniref:Tc toxin subunit A-related protein n=1 Tax=Moritella sp. 28 TaxID=2746232 RepID=UPI001BA490C0|nr:neuraminidase-like domain-containing protein [Moritella sp. 28]QUM84380.1 hypothetical protein HWV02_07580 [Moritella sp. 28]
MANSTQQLFDNNASYLQSKGYDSLINIGQKEFDSFKNDVQETLSLSDIRDLHRGGKGAAVQLEAKQRNVVKRANPQLQHAMNMAMGTMTGGIRGFDDIIPPRADSYVKQESVASMFSPAAYLTELYREGKKLHDANSPAQLNHRRPDLTSLILSQRNLDETISTLALSNEVLRAHINDDDLDMQLADTIIGVGLPYHAPFSRLSSSMALSKIKLEEITHLLSPNVLEIEEEADWLFSNNLPPTLAQYLTRPVATDSDALNACYGMDNVDYLSNVDNLCRLLDISREELVSYLSFPAIYESKSCSAPSRFDRPVAPNEYSGNYIKAAHYIGSPGEGGKGQVLHVNDGILCTRTFSHTPFNDPSLVYSLSILPSVGDDNVSISVASSLADASDSAETIIKLDGKDIYHQKAKLQYGKYVHIQHTISKASITFEICRGASVEGGIWQGSETTITFNEAQDLEPAVLIRLYNMVRYCKASGLTPEIIGNLIHLSGGNITNETFKLTSHALKLINNDSLREDDAAVLLGSDINAYALAGKLNQFDRLFNNPCLGEQLFSVCDLEGSISFDSTHSETAYERSVLQRAFGVDDAGLQMLSVICGVDTRLSLTNISKLYRISMLARIHQLLPQELACIVNLIDLSDKINSTELHDIYTCHRAVSQVCQWLVAENIGVVELKSMTMKPSDFVTDLTPDIESFLRTLYHAGQNIAPENWLEAIAPSVAAGFGLQHHELACCVMDWTEKVARGSDLNIHTVADYSTSINRFFDSNENVNVNNIVQFTHLMSQLACIVKMFELSVVELRPLLKNAGLLPGGNKNYLNICVDTLRDFSVLKTVERQVGQGGVDALLHYYAEGQLTRGNIAIVFADKYPQSEIKEVFYACCKTDDNATVRQLGQMVEILEYTRELNLSVHSLLQLSTLRNVSTYTDFKQAADSVEATLPEHKKDMYRQQQEETTSSALCGYFLLNETTDMDLFGGENRNGIYQYLLLDNQVTGQVQTTRIAEAVSSVQLYINRCLQGMEFNVNTDRFTSRFFAEWEQYNKRYNSWASVSKLAYYPENYVEPSLRYNQTNLQQALLSQISQDKLNQDVVDDAYLSYLSSFEEIANLEMLSGYHDAPILSQGYTYFVARSASQPAQYYWRSLNNDMGDDLGSYTASAWSAWEKIEAPIANAVNDEVRPVMFNNRLYIAWIESTEKAEQSEPTNGAPIMQTEYRLKLSYRKIDGTWSPESSYFIEFDAQSKFHITYTDKNKCLLGYVYKPEKQGDLGGEKVYLIDFNMQCTEQDADEFKAVLEGGLGSKEDNYIIRALKKIPLNVQVSSDEDDRTGEDENVQCIVSAHLNNNVSPPHLEYDCQATVTSKKGSWDCIPVVSDLLQWFIKIELDMINTEIDEKGRIRPVFNIMRSHREEFSRIRITLCVGEGPRKNPSSVVRREGGSYGRRIRAAQFEEFDAVPKYKMFVAVLDYYGNVHRGICTVELKPKLSHSCWADNPLSGQYYIPQNIDTQVHQSYETPFDSETETITESFVVYDGKKEIYRNTFSLEATGDEYSSDRKENARIVKGSNGACYLEFTNKPRQTRLNTLFAKELVKRAYAGVDNVLTWDTQQLAEPQLGKGFYCNVILDEYNSAVNGKSKWFKLHYANFYAENDSLLAYEGTLSETKKTTVQLFFPYPDKGNHGWCNGGSQQAHLEVEYQKSHYRASDGKSIIFTYDRDSNRVIQVNNDQKALGFSCSEEMVNQAHDEPMDFSGANGLYLWELFYYTPILVADKLLQAQSFEDAERWLKYVFSPSGYVGARKRRWNSRPLQEDRAWDATQIETTDPDVVALADPMHYKVATYMKLLDIIIARGDMAYRQLERDSLAEAKICYITAANFLGDEPKLSLNSSWNEPTLHSAADKMTQSLLPASKNLLSTDAKADTQISPSLTGLFLPCENEKLKGYYQTLTLRLHNLRHNLSINGQPLTQPIYALPVADSKSLQSAAVVSSAGNNGGLPSNITIGIQRFPIMLENAKGMVNQLMQYGNALTSVLDRKDGEALNALLQTQAKYLMKRSVQMQDVSIKHMETEQGILSKTLIGAETRRDHYQVLLDEGVSHEEQRAISERIASGTLGLTANAMRTTAAALDMAPNVFGMACGGSRWGAIPEAIAYGMDVTATGLNIAAESRTTSEQYRRRGQEWALQRDAATHEVTQLKAQQESLKIQLEATVLQKEYLITQQFQTQAQLNFLNTKFSNDALYSWMQGRLSSIFYQYYDLTVARCLKAELGYQWETSDTATFIRPGAWDSNHAGLLCGEALMLNLAQMDSAYFDWDNDALEVTRTVSMATEMDSSTDAFNHSVKAALQGAKANGEIKHELKLEEDKFSAKLNLSALNIDSDYPEDCGVLGKRKRIKQISVSLPALLAPYQDIQAVLSYTGTNTNMHISCRQSAISHGINDSGQFQLDFNDGKYQPFEGLPIAGDDENSCLTLNFPNATGKQQAVLESLNDIVFHIRYTITQ